MLQGEELSLPLLQRLKDLALRQGDLTVDELVTETLDAMALFDLASAWPDANQVRANLLRLIGEAQAFVAADREALAGGGFYGSGLKTFLAWLGSQLEGKDGDRQPDAQVHDEEAVQLMTWHAAKGQGVARGGGHHPGSQCLRECCPASISSTRISVIWIASWRTPGWNFPPRLPPAETNEQFIDTT